MTALRRQILLESLMGIVLLAATAFLQNAAREIGSTATAVVPLPPEMIGLSVNPKIIRRLLGTRILVADLLWIDTLIKADIVHTKESFTPLFHATKAIVTLDPDNVYAYYVMGLYLSVIKDDIKGATEILREGAEYLETLLELPAGAWRVPFTLGYNLLFEEQAIDEGTDWIRKAAQMPGAPKYVKDLGEHVSTEQGKLEVGSRVLSELYRHLTNPEDKKRVEKKMLDVAERQELLDLNTEFETFLSTTGAYALSRARAFQLFLRSTGHSNKDMLERKLEVNSFGKIDISR